MEEHVLSKYEQEELILYLLMCLLLERLAPRFDVEKFVRELLREAMTGSNVRHQEILVHAYKLRMELERHDHTQKLIYEIATRCEEILYVDVEIEDRPREIENLPTTVQALEDAMNGDERQGEAEDGANRAIIFEAITNHVGLKELMKSVHAEAALTAWIESLDVAMVDELMLHRPDFEEVFSFIHDGIKGAIKEEIERTEAEEALRGSHPDGLQVPPEDELADDEDTDYGDEKDVLLARYDSLTNELRELQAMLGENSSSEAFRLSRSIEADHGSFVGATETLKQDATNLGAAETKMVLFRKALENTPPPTTVIQPLGGITELVDNDTDEVPIVPNNFGDGKTGIQIPPIEAPIPIHTQRQEANMATNEDSSSPKKNGGWRKLLRGLAGTAVLITALLVGIGVWSRNRSETLPQTSGGAYVSALACQGTEANCPWISLEDMSVPPIANGARTACLVYLTDASGIRIEPCSVPADGVIVTDCPSDVRCAAWVDDGQLRAIHRSCMNDALGIPVDPIGNCPPSIYLFE